MPNSVNFCVIFYSMYVIYGCGHGPCDTTCWAMAMGWKPFLLCLTAESNDSLHLPAWVNTTS
jgi:hypothetical protein